MLSRSVAPPKAACSATIKHGSTTGLPEATRLLGCTAHSVVAPCPPLFTPVRLCLCLPLRLSACCPLPAPICPYPLLSCCARRDDFTAETPAALPLVTAAGFRRLCVRSSLILPEVHTSSARLCARRLLSPKWRRLLIRLCYLR